MIKKDIQISTELGDIITSLTSVISITSISESSGVSTINTTSVIIFDNLSIKMQLQDNMIVTLGNINYQVSNVINTPTTKSFDITGTGLTATEWNVAANYHAGKLTEINEILIQERTDDNKFKRWPLIWYIYSDNRDYDNQVIDFESTVNIVFAYKSNITDKTITRIDNNINPILNPLLSLFLLWVQSSDFNYMIELGGRDKPFQSKTQNWPFYGSQSKKNVLETSTDAIELEIDLKFKKQYIDSVGTPAQFKLIEGGFFLLLN